MKAKFSLKKMAKIGRFFSLAGLVFLSDQVTAQPINPPNVNGGTFQLNPDMSDEFNDPNFEIIGDSKWAWSSNAIPPWDYNPYATVVGNSACLDYSDDVINIESEGVGANETSFLRLSIQEITDTCYVGGITTPEYHMPYKLADITGRHKQEKGYFEIKMRIPNVSGTAHKGIAVAAWLWCVNPMGGGCIPGVWSEIDLAEIRAHDNLFTSNVHFDPHSGKPNPHPTSFPHSDSEGQPCFINQDGVAYPNGVWLSNSHNTMRCGPNNMCNWQGESCDVQKVGSVDENENPFDQLIDGNWHVYSAYWTSNFIAIYFDGVLVNKTTLGLPDGHEPMNWRFGLGFNPTVFPNDVIDEDNLQLPYHMDVDYIRTYREEPCLNNYPASKITGRTVSGDFDRDGVQDEIVTFYSYPNNQTKAHVWKRDGQAYNYVGTWYDSGVQNLDASKMTYKMVSGDFDNDGFHDDICALYDLGSSNTRAYVWESTGSYFQSPTAFYNSQQGGQGYFDANRITARVVSGDFDNDGYHDDVAAITDLGASNSTTYVWRSGGSSFTWPVSWYSSLQGGQGYFDANKVIGRVVSGDFDNDGFHDDIAAIRDMGGANTRTYVWRSGGSSFAWPSSWYNSQQGGANYFDANTVTGRVVSGDFDNDGFHDDIAAISDMGNSNSRAYVWKSGGTSFGWPSTWFNSLQGGQGYSDANKFIGRVVSGDFDNDGHHDDICGFQQTSALKSKLYNWEGTGVNFRWPNEVWKTCFDDFTHPLCPHPKSSVHLGVNSNNEQLEDRSDAVSIYPNPANSIVNVTIWEERNQAVEVRLLDVNGREVYQMMTKESMFSIDTESLPNGIYYIYLTTDDQMIDVKKLVLQH